MLQFTVLHFTVLHFMRCAAILLHYMHYTSVLITPIAAERAAVERVSLRQPCVPGRPAAGVVLSAVAA
jgi:hypothetical protein